MGRSQLLLLLGLLLPLGLPNPSWGVLLAASGLTVSALTRRHRGWPLVHGAHWCLALGVLITSVHGSQWQRHQPPARCWYQPFAATVTLIEFPRTDVLDDGTVRQRSVARVDPDVAGSCFPSGRVPVSYYQPQPVLSLGDRWEATVVLKPLASQWSPGALPDQARHAARGQLVRATLADLSIQQSKAWGVEHYRRALAAAIQHADLGADETALLLALVVGDAGALSSDQWQQFRALGIAHVLVISGLHIGLAAGFAWWLCTLPRRLWLIPGDRGKTGFPTAVAWCVAIGYASLAGFSIPTQRALFMLSVAFLLLNLGWRSRPWCGLLVAVNAVLIINPHAALGSGLWMSAGATGVLLQLAQATTNRRGVFLEAFWLQLRLTLLLLPLGWFWFGEASLLSVITNLTLVPVLTLWVVPLALFGALISGISSSLATLVWDAAVTPVPFVWAAIDWLYVHAGEWGLIQRGLTLTQLVVASSLVVAVLSRQWRWLVAAVAGLVVALQWPLARGPELSVLDIGQGTAVTFRWGERVLLYDTGGGVPGGFLQSRKIIRPYLASQQLSRIDTLVVSHRDRDHSAGVEDIKQHVVVGRHLGFGGEPCRAGESWRWSSTIRFLMLSGSGQGVRDTNADSCVLLIEADGKRVLLAGDIPLKRERELVRYWRDALKADLLLVGHHGSNTSTGHTWLKWVQPDTAILSAARGNRFGHPATRVIERLELHDVEIVNTADAGTLRWTLASGRWRFRAMRGAWTPYWLRLD